MGAGIFISYRRDESRHAAGRLADDLAQAFGAQAIFRDIEGIDPGVDFTRSLERALEACSVMLVLIGPSWLDMRDPHGKRRLDDPNDWIRQEIATALARDVRVIPVLLEGAAMPSAQDLPDDLDALVRRQALDMSDSRWRGDLQRLIEALEKVPGLGRLDPPAPSPPPVPAPAPAGKGRWVWIGAGALGVLVVAGLFSEGEFDEPLPIDPLPVGPGPAVAPVQPAARPAATAAVPDIAGMWRTNTGEVYHFEQDGRDVYFTAQAGGQPMGEGHGQFDGQVLRLALTLQVQGRVMGTANCDMHPAPDHRSYTGQCMGPNGPFPAQFFR